MRIVFGNLISKWEFASSPTELLEVSYYSCNKIPDGQLSISSEGWSPRYETSPSRLQLTTSPYISAVSCHTRVQNVITWNITEAPCIFTVRITLSEHQEPTLGPSHCVPAIVYRAARHWIPSPLHDKECLLSSNLTLCCTWWQQTLLPFSPS